MTKMFCDHCGVVITHKDDYPDYMIEFEAASYECDLCARCYTLITNEIDNRLKEFIKEKSNG